MTSQDPTKRLLRSSTSTIESLHTSRQNTDSKDCRNKVGEAVKCRICLEVFVGENDMLVICDRCENWVCLQCSGLSETQYKSLDGNLQWYCDDCKLPAIQAVKVDRSIEEKCKEYLDAFKEEFKTEIDNQLKEMREDIQDIRNKQMQSNPSGDKVETTVQKAIQESIKIQEQEQNDREKRKNNIILFNVVEAETNMKEERLKHDTELFKRICDEICDGNTNRIEVTEIRRIGKKSEIRDGEKTENRCRPMIVKLKEQTSKRQILVNANKIHDSKDDSLKPVRMSHDLTLKERETAKHLHQEAKRRENQDTSGGFKYKVRGPPWDMRIVRIKIGQ